MIVNLIPYSHAPAGEGPEGIELLLPHLSEVFWSALAVVIIAVVVAKFALPKFNAILDERTAKIESGLALAKKAKQDSRKADEEAQRTIAEARQVAADIREQASQEAKKTIEDATEKARVEAERVMANAHRQIEADRQAAHITLRADIGLLAAELAEKIVGEQLKDRELSARVIDRFLDDLEAETLKQGTKGD
ncbi:MAG: F0F1 ATP synthase subunit B [Actinomycetaceae bacterium]|nr:F0F1 ATP synthase subunit B [Actinomycetaceae bacterium]